jgi:nucleotide-binding universal stress UspA family protein
VFNRILIPVDFSKKNKQAIDMAAEIACSGTVTMYVLHVIETLADATYEEFRDIYAKLENEAAKKMDTLLKPYRDKAVDLRTSIIVGNRVKGILDFISEHDIDLIIMSSHKIGVQEPAQDWGTISYKIGILSPSPVMLVK